MTDNDQGMRPEDRARVEAMAALADAIVSDIEAGEAERVNAALHSVASDVDWMMLAVNLAGRLGRLFRRMASEHEGQAVAYGFTDVAESGEEIDEPGRDAMRLTMFILNQDEDALRGYVIGMHGDQERQHDVLHALVDLYASTYSDGVNLIDGNTGERFEFDGEGGDIELTEAELAAEKSVEEDFIPLLDNEDRDGINAYMNEHVTSWSTWMDWLHAFLPTMAARMMESGAIPDNAHVTEVKIGGMYKDGRALSDEHMSALRLLEGLLNTDMPKFRAALDVIHDGGVPYLTTVTQWLLDTYINWVVRGQGVTMQMNSNDGLMSE